VAAILAAPSGILCASREFPKVLFSRMIKVCSSTGYLVVIVGILDFWLLGH
jgi:hypothetical protein